MSTRPLYLGCSLPMDGTGAAERLTLPAHHLTTHSVIVGMTGSGKTGLAMTLVEESLRSRIPVLMIDVKGDLGNLFYAFPSLAAEQFEPYVDAEGATRDDRSVHAVAEELATARASGLATWGLGDRELRAFHDGIAPRIITPGTHAGEMLHVLSSLELPSPLWATDPEAARESLAASISLVLRLVGRDPDPTRSRDHVLLAHLAELRLRAGKPADIGALIDDVTEPPVEELGALPLEDFVPKKDRKALANALNTLLASPTFESWRSGVPLDVGAWLKPAADGKTPAVIVSVAHLDDDARALVLGLLFEELLAWVRTLPGTSELQALIVFDEVFGFLPPHPANPPAKRPLLSLMKQARAFGVGMVLATQNPMDLDYRALSNAGLWFVGRLQTDADRERVVEGLAGVEGGAGAGEAMDAADLGAKLKMLAPRWFVMRDVHRTPAAALVQTRWTLSWMRGPMTRGEIRRVSGGPKTAHPTLTTTAIAVSPAAQPENSP
ncbi:MAG: helicase HerA-like domain-containing protein [Deltaproteobacteria bacterium]